VQAEYGNCHVMSVCQPTVPVLAAISLMASRGEATPLTMTMMGGPIDARRSPTSVNNLAMNKSFEWFENNVIYRVPQGFPGEGRRVYPGFLQHTGFVAMNPDRHATSHYDYFKDLVKGDDASAEAHRKFYDEYNAVLDMDADYYLETISTVFQEFKLVHGTWDVRNEAGQIERVRPQDIPQSALLTVEGELDDISGSGQTRAAHDLCTQIPSEHREHYEVAGAGHYGIFSGRRWREMVYPKVRAFIAAHDQPQTRDDTPLAAEDVRRGARAAKPAAVPAEQAAPAPSAAAPAPRKAAVRKTSQPARKVAEPPPVATASPSAADAAPRKSPARRRTRA
ncbi:MAG: polyhydroxyalkanoate depolymerase, partial [Pseudacidovorax sp.]|nr:polyhydroxyalkanoate depolymerase [Pseudacidovorax sp.]